MATSVVCGKADTTAHSPCKAATIPSALRVRCRFIPGMLMPACRIPQVAHKAEGLPVRGALVYVNVGRLERKTTPHFEYAAVVRKLDGDSAFSLDSAERCEPALNAQIRIGRLGMIQNIRAVHPNFHIHALVDLDPLGNRHIEVPIAGSKDLVAEIAELSGARRTEDQITSGFVKHRIQRA